MRPFIIIILTLIFLHFLLTYLSLGCLVSGLFKCLASSDLVDNGCNDESHDQKTDHYTCCDHVAVPEALWLHRAHLIPAIIKLTLVISCAWKTGANVVEDEAIS